MRLYQRWLLPRLINWSMRNRDLAAYRERLVAAAWGRVLEIGVGSGLNLPFYTGAAQIVLGLDPAGALLRMARRKLTEAPCPVLLLAGSAEAIPLKDGSVDTIVMTWTLCSIPDPHRALQEMRRVLRPDGELLFVEHGLAPEPRVEAWQHRLTPIWSRIGGGCHLDRPMDRLVASAGFEITELRKGYMNRLKPMTFMYEGSARPVQ